jgi:hypothetical protein
LKEASEPILSGKIVQLNDAQNNSIRSTTTNSDGLYSFQNVLPATYTVAVLSGANYIFSPIVVGGNQMKPNGAMKGISSSLTLNAGDDKDDVHIGMYKVRCDGSTRLFLLITLFISILQSSNLHSRLLSATRSGMITMPTDCKSQTSLDFQELLSRCWMQATLSSQQRLLAAMVITSFKVSMKL